jgi:hypothetical protein
MDAHAARQHAAPHYFPLRPPRATLLTQEGILVGYRVGEAAGTLDLRTADGHTDVFYIGVPMRIDGRRVKCTAPPADENAADDHPADDHPARAANCPDWPAGLRLGHSHVRVTYWRGKLHDGSHAHTLVTDQLETLPETDSGAAAPPGRTSE